MDITERNNIRAWPL